jgi:hypothetical protein
VRFSAGPTEFYAVGWLEALRSKGRRGQQLRRQWRYCLLQAKAGKWRAVRMTFNGWMYEPSPWPENAQRCGSGWTQRRAVRSFWRYYQRDRAGESS